MTDAPPVPHGWYPDPWGAPHSRWWDGVQWTDQVAPAALPEVPKAPAGTRTNTVWIWLVAVVPLLGLAPYLLVDITGMTSAMTSRSAPPPIAGMLPGFIASAILGWAGVASSIVFGYLDHRTLVRRGVPQPFHWAFGFLVFVYSMAAVVYPIGRTIVARRRAAAGLAPMIVAIAVQLVILVVSAIWTMVFFSAWLSVMSTFAAIP